MILSWYLGRVGDSKVPPLKLNESILNLVQSISELIGRWDGAQRPKPKVKLRKKNRIRSIQASLAIEGNSLSLEQVTAILENKRVLGPKKEVTEVINAIEAHGLLPSLQPWKEKDFLKLHSVLMKGLIPDSGKFRSSQVGVMKGAKVSHVAPPAIRVPNLIHELFSYGKISKMNPLVLSCIVHYEIEFIHPFMDGNGRMGRLWQSLILAKHYPVFEFVPVEDWIIKNQMGYYRALEESDKRGESGLFVEFMLERMLEALGETLHPAHFESVLPSDRLERARTFLGGGEFSRAEYLRAVGRISAATASRDLADGVRQGLLAIQGDKRTARYRFK